MEKLHNGERRDLHFSSSLIPKLLYRMFEAINKTMCRSLKRLLLHRCFFDPQARHRLYSAVLPQTFQTEHSRQMSIFNLQKVTTTPYNFPPIHHSS
jgi:hypothetical protein